MPIYDYVCANCGHQCEAIQGFNDAPLVTCSACGQDQLEKRLMSAPRFQLKGKGWYKSDYSSSTVRPSSAGVSTVSSDTPSPTPTPTSTPKET